MPTETVYGLAGCATNEAACRSIFRIKGRPLIDPLIVHVRDTGMAAGLAQLPPAFDTLAQAFWPGPLTVILARKPVVPDIVTAGKPTVALRMPRHPVALALLAAVGAPLAAPSANPFGYVSPSLPQHVADSFGGKVPFILDGGACEIGVESTILDLADPARPAVLRPGAISAEQLSDALGMLVPVRRTLLHHGETATAPGTFARHYSPQTPLLLFEGGQAPAVEPGEAVILLRRPVRPTADNVYWLSEDGSTAAAARSLFALLRSLDKGGCARIHCEVPGPGSTGLELAIRDRILRAAARQ